MTTNHGGRPTQLSGRPARLEIVWDRIVRPGSEPAPFHSQLSSTPFRSYTANTLVEHAPRLSYDLLSAPLLTPFRDLPWADLPPIRLDFLPIFNSSSFAPSMLYGSTSSLGTTAGIWLRIGINVSVMISMSLPANWHTTTYVYFPTIEGYLRDSNFSCRRVELQLWPTRCTRAAPETDTVYSVRTVHCPAIRYVMVPIR